MSVLTIPREIRLTVLLADDDENDLLLIQRAARDFKAVGKLVCVSSGEEVMAYLEGDLGYGDRQVHPPPDVVVLDQFMPRWTGLDVLLWMRSSLRFAHLPVVLVSLGLSPAQQEQATLLRAAWCPKTTELEIHEAVQLMQMQSTA